MPVPPVELDIRVGGMAGVRSAFADVDRLLDRFQTTSKRKFVDAANARVRLERDANKRVEREAKNAARELEREERQRTRVVEAEAKKRERAERDRLREEKRARDTAHREEVDSLHRLQRERDRRANTVGRVVGGAVTRTAGMVGRLAAIGGTLLGGFGVADALQSGISNESRAGIVYRGAADQGGIKGPESVLSVAKAAAVGVGGTTADMLAGLDQFVRKTGDLGKGVELLSDLSKLAAATATSFEDMGSTAAEVFSQLKEAGVKDVGATVDVMRALAGHGRAGAIDIKDLGQYGGRLAANASKFEGSVASNIESFSVIAQLAKKLGGADIAESTMSISRIPSDLTKHSGELANLGVKVFADQKTVVRDGKTQVQGTYLRNAEDLIVESIAATKGDLGQLTEIYGERSAHAMIGAQIAYRRAGGGKAGEQAIRSQFAELKATKLTTKEIDKNVADAKLETERRINVAMENFRGAINEKLLPQMPKLIEAFSSLVPAISKAVEIFARNPFAGFGAIVGAYFLAELAAAKIPMLIAGAFKGLASTTGTGGAGGLAGLSGLGAAAGVGVGIGAAVGTGIYAGGIASFERGESSMKTGGERLKAARESNSLARVKELYEAQRKEVASFSQGTKQLESLVNPNIDVERRTQTDFLLEMKAKLEKLESASKELSAAAASLGPSYSSPDNGNRQPMTSAGGP